MAYPYSLTDLLTFSSRLSGCTAGVEAALVVLSSSKLGVLIVMGGAVGVVWRGVASGGDGATGGGEISA